MRINRLSVVIVTYNSRVYIEGCLKSIFNQEQCATELIVVDNGSKDGTAEFVEHEYPQVVLLRNKSNLGACKARNKGIESSTGNWVMVLDSDIVLENGFFSKTYEILENIPPEVGIVQPKILNGDKETLYSCGIYLSRIRRFYDMGKGQRNGKEFSGSRYVFGACSACALYDRALLDAIKERTGYFDERFFFLVEDVDISWRAQRKGWKAMFIPQLISYHSGNCSHTPEKIRKRLCFKNRHIMILKNETLLKKILLIVISLPYELTRMVYFFLCVNRNIARQAYIRSNK